MEFLTLLETAKMLGVDRRTLWKAIKDGAGHPPFVMIGKRKKFRREDVERWAREQPSTPAADGSHVQ